MKQETHILEQVDAIYQGLRNELVQLDQQCTACGQCCDFESFGHRLYITTPELIYFRHFVAPPIKEMATGVCPYCVDGKCTVYPYRFAGCRIFTCKGDAEKENRICEEAIRRLKSLCDGYGLDYHYVSLPQGLKMLTSDVKFKTQNL